MKNKDIILMEYSYIFDEETYPEVKGTEKHIPVDKKTFENIEAFVLQNLEYAQYLKLGQNKRYKFLQAQNYVGIIKTNNGVTIEILPKISEIDNISKSKNILIKMLKTLKNSPFKNLKTANLEKEKIDIFEIFISMFLEEISLLIKKGIKMGYVDREGNLNFLKGKLKINEHIKENFIRKERFFVQYDNFNIDRIENHIIKTTLDFLLGKTKVFSNKVKISQLQQIFIDIAPISNYSSNFPKCHLNRQMVDYKTILKWCEIFLLKNSFSPYKGTEVAFALLFDMNKLFESYVGYYLKNINEIGNIKLQNSEHFLALKKGNGCFKLKPDIVIEREDEVIICDTKWKVMDREPNQGDMYQLFAYGNKYYNCKKLYLIYPYIKNISPIIYNFNIHKTLELEVIYFNLETNEFYGEEDKISKKL